VSWVKLDDGFPGHPKVDALLQDSERDGLAAIGLFALALCRAGHQLTDGDLTERAVRTIAPETADELAAQLVEVGLLEVRENGWYIHDYLDWNPSRETVLARRQTETDRKAAARLKAAEARANKASEDLSRRDTPRDNRRDSRADSGRPSALPVPSRPVPSFDDEGTREVCPSGFVMDSPASALHPDLQTVVGIFRAAKNVDIEEAVLNAACFACQEDVVACAHLAASWAMAGTMSIRDAGRLLGAASDSRAKKAATLDGIRAAAEKGGGGQRPVLTAVQAEDAEDQARAARQREWRLKMEAAADQRKSGAA
jgi:hypothetical protein